MRIRRRPQAQLILPGGEEMDIGGQVDVVFSIKEAIVFAVSFLVLGILLTILAIIRPEILMVVRWIMSTALVAATITFVFRWQRRRLQALEPDTCIKCGQLLDPNEDQCLNCGVAIQASLKLDVGAIIAMLSTVAMLLAGLIVGWKAMWTLMGLLCLTFLLLFYYNRKDVSLRYGMGLGNILQAGYKAAAALAAGYAVWLVWVLS